MEKENIGPRTSHVLTYRITGKVAEARIVPLLHKLLSEIDDDEHTERVVQWRPATATEVPHFLWENTPLKSTTAYRDHVQVYSHLPNGILLDSKWAVLGRLLRRPVDDEDDNRDTSQPSPPGCHSNYPLATLETICFRGRSGFIHFANAVGLLSEQEEATNQIPQQSPQKTLLPRFRDFMIDPAETTEDSDLSPPYPEPNVWVVKDAHANGAGGVWVVGPSNAAELGGRLCETHEYVAQKYAWPPLLYHRRKFHVRVYGLITADGNAYLHKRCFLHVANDTFDITNPHALTKESIHITNCCANSHDNTKFAGEICADLTMEQNNPCNNNKNYTADTVGLAAFFPSMAASLATLTKNAWKYIQGGSKHNGFEYMGLDFILSYQQHDNTPVAYLLEVNAPPSQDTATQLPHAELTHNTVLSDLLTLWVLPKLLENQRCFPSKPGGWICVYKNNPSSLSSSLADTPILEAPEKQSSIILPSKAAVLNKMKWAITERQLRKSIGFTDDMAKFAQSHFPYFSRQRKPKNPTTAAIFFENAGGTQVPECVVEAMRDNLVQRHRAVLGARCVDRAKGTIEILLGCKNEETDSDSSHFVALGANASTLLFTLAQRYVQAGMLKLHDEIVMSLENHLANVQPWEEAAKLVGAQIKTWDPTTTDLESMLTDRTRIVAISHASNIVGTLMDVSKIQSIVHQCCRNAHVVVDGVAAAPHYFANLKESQLDWYVVSFHKLFGPHLAALCGSYATTTEELRRNLQIGTVNYEACEGILGLGKYFIKLSSYKRAMESISTSGKSAKTFDTASLTQKHMKDSYHLIENVEAPLIQALLDGLLTCKKVRVVSTGTGKNAASNLPIVSFLHRDIPSSQIVSACRECGVICRNGTFLSTKAFRDKHNIDDIEGVVRFSLAHYNTMSEVHRALRVLQSIPGWK
jgi:selenocysteine lyase/cysteine desulfurase